MYFATSPRSLRRDTDGIEALRASSISESGSGYLTTTAHSHPTRKRDRFSRSQLIIDGVHLISRLKIPRPDESSKEFFRSLLPDDPRVKVRPMFGNVSAFVNGNMFMGVFGNDLFLRLSGEDREKLLTEKGASLFEPMKGRPMKEYILIPRSWKSQPATVNQWVSRSLAWASKLPQKTKH